MFPSNPILGGMNWRPVDDSTIIDAAYAVQLLHNYVIFDEKKIISKVQHGFDDLISCEWKFALIVWMTHTTHRPLTASCHLEHSHHPNIRSAPEQIVNFAQFLWLFISVNENRSHHKMEFNSRLMLDISAFRLSIQFTEIYKCIWLPLQSFILIPI